MAEISRFEKKSIEILELGEIIGWLNLRMIEYGSVIQESKRDIEEYSNFVSAKENAERKLKSNNIKLDFVRQIEKLLEETFL